MWALSVLPNPPNRSNEIGTLHETVCIITYGDLTEALTQQISKQAHGLRHSTPENSSASRVNSVTTLEPTEPLMSKAVNYHHLSYEYVEEQSDQAQHNGIENFVSVSSGALRFSTPIPNLFHLHYRTDYQAVDKAIRVDGVRSRSEARTVKACSRR